MFNDFIEGVQKGLPLNKKDGIDLFLTPACCICGSPLRLGLFPWEDSLKRSKEKTNMKYHYCPQL
jgi:hypothetical protein